jgi:hypothetical protein
MPLLSLLQFLVVSFQQLMLRLPGLGGMPMAEAVHVNGFDGDTGTFVFFVGSADKVAGIFFTPTPFIYGEVLLAHVGR